MLSFARCFGAVVVCPETASAYSSRTSRRSGPLVPPPPLDCPPTSAGEGNRMRSGIVATPLGLRARGELGWLTPWRSEACRVSEHGAGGARCGRGSAAPALCSALKGGSGPSAQLLDIGEEGGALLHH